MTAHFMAVAIFFEALRASITRNKRTSFAMLTIFSTFRSV